jgi:hypothetical protein
LNTLVGYTFRDWTKILAENRYSVGRKYLSRAAIVTQMSIMTSLDKRREDRRYGSMLSKVQEKDPIFILGHWRSGTSLLHNLHSQDQRFAFPNLFQATHPHTFLIREEIVEERLADIDPHQRQMDNVNISFKSPGEDEPALAVISLRSPVLSWVFPKNEAYYDQFLTFDGVKENETRKWESAFVQFNRKLALNYQRPLLFKSPTHTARIKIILRNYPGARFVHIHRNPYRVFQSTKRMYVKVYPNVSLQEPVFDRLDQRILSRYQVMYDAYFNDLSRIPDGQFVDVSFEDLEEDKIGQMEKIYDALTLPEFSTFKPVLEKYVDSIAGYQKNPYPKLPEIQRKLIAQSWKRSFDVWGYPA